MRKTKFWGELFDEYTTEIHIYNGQIKSLEKAKKVAEALDTLEKEMGIHVTRIFMQWCFFCPDIDLSELWNTHMENHLRNIILEYNFKNANQTRKTD
jgi:hypothetical protein